MKLYLLYGGFFISLISNYIETVRVPSVEQEVQWNTVDDVVEKL